MKWSNIEKEKFLQMVEQQQCDTFQEEIETAWEYMYKNPDESHNFPTRSLLACKIMIYKIIKEKKAKLNIT